ncbi:substrate-binding domain-containing protein [Hyphomicrobium sp. 2TAF46]|uniref:substrate-binding domain-containing protein n=1 Tax=Hyphomicrobium sp. 2TAF46 TaxID=3233019 RepID=UPI003F90E957
MKTFILWCAVGLAVMRLGPFASADTLTTHQNKPVRLAIVFAPVMSGLISDLIDDFRKQSGLEVETVAGMDIYERARAGDADIVISHCGFSEVERFVEDGYGRWPRLVFANQMVLIGPPDDPAHIQQAKSAIEAFRRLAETKSAFIPNALPVVMNLADYLWEGAGRPYKEGWYLNSTESKGRAIQLAEEKGGYVIWGAEPFLQFVQKHSTKMRILFASDPILQRVMCSVVVDPGKVPGANAEGASAFEKYLLSPRAQARVAAFRTPGASTLQLWWPAALHNDSGAAQ